MNKVKKSSRKYEEIWPIVNLNRQTLRASKDIRKKLRELTVPEILKIAKQANVKGRSKMKKKALVEETAFALATAYAMAEVKASQPVWK